MITMLKNTKFIVGLMALFIAICTVFTAAPAYAVEDAVNRGPLNFILEQENKDGINYRKVFDQLPEDIRVDLMIETEQQYNQCTSKGSYSKYYDCQCIAIKFLDKRIEIGPDMASQHIIRDVTLECPYPAGIAGISYQKCEDMFEMDIVGNLEEFCTCVANSISKNFSARPSMHSQYISFLNGRAMTECGYQEEQRNYRKLEKERDIYR